MLENFLALDTKTKRYALDAIRRACVSSVVSYDAEADRECRAPTGRTRKILCHEFLRVPEAQMA